LLLRIGETVEILEKELDDSERTEAGDSASIRIQQISLRYDELVYLISQVGNPRHPFLVRLQPRINQVKETLKRNIQESLSVARKERNDTETVKLLEICRLVDIYPF
jgi:hypothetical protein